MDEGTILPKIIRFQKYFKKQYDVVFDGLQSYHNLLKEAGITWKKTHSYKSSQKRGISESKKKSGRNY